MLSAGDAKKILVVTPSNLGDVILTLPVFQSLIEAFPGAAIDAATTQAGAMVFEGDPRVRAKVRRRHPGLGGHLEFLFEVRRERYDLILDLRYSMIGLLGGAKKRNRYFFPGGAGKHRAVRHQAALEGLVPQAKGRFWKAGEGKGKIVVAAPGSKSHLKIWPAEHFARLLDKLAENDGAKIVLVGDASDQKSAAAVKEKMRAEAADFTGRTGFNALRELVGSASLVVTNDSAPLHLADALGVPTLALFGPTSASKYGPRGPRSAALRKELFCSPCQKALCRPGGAHECMAELGPDEAYRTAKELLSGPKRRTGLRLLVVRHDRVGDVVLSLPVLKAIRDRLPDAHVAFVTRPYTRALVEGHPLVDEAIPYFYEKKGRHAGILGNLRFIREIRRRKFDAALVLHPSNRSMLVPFAAGIPVRVGLRSGPWWTLTKAVPDRRGDGRHEADATMDVARAYFGDPSIPVSAPEIPIDREEEARAAAKLQGALKEGERVIALHPGASCPSKRWPLDRFAALGRRVASDGARVAIVGGPEENEAGRRLAAEIGPAAVDLTGRFTLKELAAFFRRCDALVSNDSGPVHVAAAVGTPVVSIFGRTGKGLSEARWAPLGEGHATVRKDVGCVECLAHLCPIGFECLSALESGEVYASLGRVLEAEAAAR